MKILHLTLKKKWFDMILSGEKQEEYREIKPYWIKRLSNKTYNAILFRNGYAKNAPEFLIEYKRLSRGVGIPEWGAPEVDPVFVIELGNITEIKNIKLETK